MKKYVELNKFLTEYKEKNSENKYSPVAVGKYGIRYRESIYSKELAKDYTQNKVIFKDTLTVGMGSNQIDIGILSEDKKYSVSPAYHTYKINGINADFLRYCLECRNQDMFVRFAKRGTRQGKSIDHKRWLEYKIPVYDDNIQKTIVSKLNRVEYYIDLRKQQLNILEELIKSRFIEMFGQFPEYKNCSIKRLDDLSKVTSGGTPNREKNEYWVNGTIPWVKTTELKNNIITNTEEYITYLGLENSSAKIVPASTILLAMYGQGKTRGMTAYLGISVATNQACACILPSDKILSKYLWYYLILSYDNIRSLAEGAGQPNLNAKMIKNFPVVVPKLNKQRQYINFVENIDKSKYHIERSMKLECQILDFYKNKVNMDFLRLQP